MSASATYSWEQDQLLQIIEGLAISSICYRMDHEQLVALAEIAVLRKVRPLSEIVAEGEPLDELQVVHSGRCIVLLPGDKLSQVSGATVSLETYVPGDCIGGRGLVADSRVTASIIASELSTLIVFRASDLKALLDNDTKLAALFYANLLLTEQQREAVLNR